MCLINKIKSIFTKRDHWKNIPEPTEKDLDNIFDIIDDLCYKCHDSNDWNEINDILKNIDISQTHTDILITYLSTTHCTASKLSYYKEYQDKVKQELIKRKVDPRVYKNWD